MLTLRASTDTPVEKINMSIYKKVIDKSAISKKSPAPQKCFPSALTQSLKISQKPECRWRGLRKSRLFFKEIRFWQQIQGPDDFEEDEVHADPSPSVLQNKHSHVQPLTGVFPPKTNTETNIYRVMKIQQKSPGHEVSPPVPKISGLPVLNRKSHLLPTLGQETLRAKRISTRMYYQDKSHIFSRKCSQLQGKKGI